MFELVILLILLLFSIAVLIFVVSSFLGFIFTRVPFVPTARRDIQAIIDRVPLSSADVIYDLGSGNGKVVFMLEQMVGAKTVGFEATLWTHWYAQIKKLLTRSKAVFVLGNFFKHNWSEASIIYCYLYPPLMERIGAKIAQECRPGTTVIVRDFPIPNLAKVDYFRTYGNHEIFVYKV
jgi:hypothetical protein